MRPLNNDERKQMRHALGLDNAKRAYRNSYVAYGRSALWDGLCAIGLAIRNTFDKADKWVYHLSDEGIAAVTEASERER